MRRHKALSFLLILASLSVVPAEAFSGVIEQIIVAVDGEPYTLTDLKTFAKTKLAQTFPKGDLIRVGKEDKEILELFITEKLVAAEVKRLGIQISNEDIDRYIEQTKTRSQINDEELKEALRREGLTIEQYRASVKFEIEKNELVNNQVHQKVNITDGDVERYYQQNQWKFMTKEKLHLRHILLALAKESSAESSEEALRKASEFRRRALAGEDFAQLAQTYSEGAGASRGGDLGWVQAGQLLAEIEEAAAKLAVGRISEPVRSSLGIHLIKLEQREPARALPLTEVRTKIKGELYARALEERFQTLLKSDLRKSHRVDVKLPGVVFRPEENKDGTVKSLMASASRKAPPEKGLLSYLNPFSYIFSTAPAEGEDADSDQKIVRLFGTPLFKKESIEDDLPADPLAEPESPPAVENQESSPGFFSSVFKALNPFSSSR